MMEFSELKNISCGTTKPLSPEPPLSQSQLQQLGEEPQLQPLEEEPPRDPLGDPVMRQNSLMSLTLNEIQIKSGKCFGSMNMDEFLANLWSVEENQVSMQPNQNDHANENFMVNHQPPPVQQGSFNIPTPLCKKTVDEVWFEIQKDKPEHRNKFGPREPPQRQQTLGEITLEDFLVKAGVVQEAPKPPPPPQTTIVTMPIQNTNPSMDANFGMGPMMGLGYSTHHQSIGNNLSAGNGFVAYQMYPQSNEYAGGTSSNVKNDNDQVSSIEMVAQRNKARIIDGPPEVIVERRQRRMIKNRESAARSRARKQAYTVELELELTQLKEENAKLKQAVEELEQKRRKELLKRKPMRKPKSTADKLRTIRRTASAKW